MNIFSENMQFFPSGFLFEYGFDKKIISTQIIINLCRNLQFDGYQNKVNNYVKTIISQDYFTRIKIFMRNHSGIEENEFFDYIILESLPINELDINFNCNINSLRSKFNGFSLLINEFIKDYYDKIENLLDKTLITSFNRAESFVLLENFRDFMRLYEKRNLRIYFNPLSTEIGTYSIHLKEDSIFIQKKKNMTTFSLEGLIYFYVNKIVTKCSNLNDKYMSYYLKDKEGLFVRNTIRSLKEYVNISFTRCVNTIICILAKYGSLDYLINNFDSVCKYPYLLNFSISKVFLRDLIRYNTQAFNFNVFFTNYFTNGGNNLSEDGGMPITWGMSDGSYNIHNPIGNSNQDYQGYFLNPTEPIENELEKGNIGDKKVTKEEFLKENFDFLD